MKHGGKYTWSTILSNYKHAKHTSITFNQQNAKLVDPSSPNSLPMNGLNQEFKSEIKNCHFSKWLFLIIFGIKIRTIWSMNMTRRNYYLINSILTAFNHIARRDICINSELKLLLSLLFLQFPAVNIWIFRLLGFNIQAQQSKYYKMNGWDINIAMFQYKHLNYRKLWNILRKVTWLHC